MRRVDCPVLVGRHVRLEPLGFEHGGALLEVANEARGTFAKTFVPSSPAAMEAYVTFALKEHEAGRGVPFVVKDAAGEVIGSTRFTDLEHWDWADHPPPPPVPRGPDAVEIGYTWYAERVQRTAVNTEAKLLLCSHAFETWAVRRITWKTDERNDRSRAAILRLGARFDGVLRAHRPAADGTVRSTAFFSMLASEWPEARRALIARLERGR